MLSYATRESQRPPELPRELRDCPDWLASRLQRKDALVRDVRVWHGGCPNLCGEARYLPSLDVTSPEYDDWFYPVWEAQERERGKYEEGGWALPLAYLDRIVDPRARRRCREVAELKLDGEANQRAGDPTWLARDVSRMQ